MSFCKTRLSFLQNTTYVRCCGESRRHQPPEPDLDVCGNERFSCRCRERTEAGRKVNSLRASSPAARRHSGDARRSRFAENRSDGPWRAGGRGGPPPHDRRGSARGDPLILAIKADVDRHGFDSGRFVLAGSSRFLTVPTLTESLAGRARIIDLWPLSQVELKGTSPQFVDALFSSPRELRTIEPAVVSRKEVIERLAIGGFPAVIRIASARAREDWFADYITTLLQRDLAQLRTPRRVVDLPRLLRLIGQRTSRELVIAPMASGLGLTADTVREYLGLFESIFLHHTIPAWTPGGAGRVIHRPKLHIVDSGVACHLLGVGVDELIRPGVVSVGAVLESFVAGEIHRQIPWSNLRPSLHHYRDNSKREIDLISRNTRRSGKRR